MRPTPPDLAPVRAPSRPGPGHTPAAALAQLDLHVRRRLEGLLSGEYRSTALGPGTELFQLRPYRPGDDVRLLDASASARTGEPHVRVQVAERALTTWLVLDTSPSMQFGTADRRKADVAEGVALVVGRLATRYGNRLGLLTFGDRAPRTLPPRRGHVGLLALLTTLRQAPAEAPGSTSLGEALTRAGRVAQQRGLVAVVSDLRGPRDWRQPLLTLVARHDVLAVEIRDPREQALPDVGELTLVDPETGHQLRVDTARPALRERFAAAAAAERQATAEALRSAGVDHLVLSTAGDWLGPLCAFLRLRGRR